MVAVMKRRSSGTINLLYVLPLLLVCAAYLVYPLCYTARIAFAEWNGIDRSLKNVGFANFVKLFTDDPVLPTILVNFVVFTVITIFCQCFFGLVFAALVNKVGAGASSLYKTIIFAPAVLTPVIIGNVFFRLFDPNVGLSATILRSLGLGGLVVPLLADPNTALLAVCAVQIWQWTGYSMLLYIAGMSLIPKDVYEAAWLDGARAPRVFFRITVPMLRSTTYMLAMVGTINALKQFDLVYTLTRGGPANATQFFSIYIYRNSFELFKQGYASAVAMVMFAISLVITVFYLRRYDAGR